jgi:hypothetical protein
MKTKTEKTKTTTAKTTTQKTHWPVHPLALLFPTKTPEERVELKKDMVDRANRGIDPLEVPVLRWDGQILDGRHRDEVWMELAEEGAANGFFARNRPPTEEFKPGKQGTLAAWMRAKSRNLVVRQTHADQRAAIFLKAVKQFPELNAVLDEIKAENLRRQKAGQPLGAGDQRGNTNEQVAEMAQVGTTTVKQVKRLEKEAPEKFEEVAKGKKRVKEALKEVNEKKNARTSKNRKQARPDKASPSRKPAVITCSVRLDVLPADGMAAEEVFSRLLIRKAELRTSGLHIWLRSAKPVPLSAGAPLPKGCLGEVTGIEGRGFKLEGKA